MQLMEGDLAATIETESAAHRPYPARRQSRPQRAGHRRNQLSRSCSAASTSSATPAGSAANTSRATTTDAGLGWFDALSAEAAGLAGCRIPLFLTSGARHMSNIGFIGLGIMGAPWRAISSPAGTSCSFMVTRHAAEGAAGQGAPSPARAPATSREAPTSSSSMVPDTPECGRRPVRRRRRRRGPFARARSSST